MATFSREAGFSLLELLLVVAILGMVVAGVFGVYLGSQDGYTRAISLEHAQVGARAGLDRIATELRLIGAQYQGLTGSGNAITAATATSITFWGDVDADTLSGSTEITTTAAATAGGTTVAVSGTAQQASDAFSVFNSTPTLNDFVYLADGATQEVRQVASVAGTTITLAAGLTNGFVAGSRVRSVERITYAVSGGNLTRSVGGGTAEVIVDNVTNLTLTYFDTSGVQTGTVSQIREIQIALTTRGNDGSLRTMTSRVKPRNL